MNIPKIKSAYTLDHHSIMVTFDNDEKKCYDISPLLEKEAFIPLNNPAFFSAVKVEKGGYAVYWNENIDLSEYEIWNNGQKVESET